MADLYLGLREPSKIAAETPKLDRAKVRALGLPAPPPEFKWLTAKSGVWGPMGNTQCGDCVIASLGHHIQLQTAWTLPAAYIAPDPTILAAYSDVTGMRGGRYDPRTGANDNGCVMEDAFAYWLKTGIGGHKLSQDAVSVDPKNVGLAVQYFGGLIFELALPLTSFDQYVQGESWDVVSTTGRGKPASWGYHAVPVFSYGQIRYGLVTWGTLIGMTRAFVKTYSVAAWVCLSTDWRMPNGKTPRGDKWTDLQSFLDAVRY